MPHESRRDGLSTAAAGRFGGRPEANSPSGTNHVARKKTSRDRIDLKVCISQRLREVRQELYGEHGGPEMARRLGLPARTWYNYESGVTVPAEVLLSFIDQTGADPAWLFSGLGPRYSRGAQSLASLAPADLIRRCLDQLHQHDPRPAIIDARAGQAGRSRQEGFVELPLVDAEDLLDDDLSPERAASRVLASKKWIAHPESTVAIRLDDVEMEPLLPIGSILGVDRATRAPADLQGRLVVANDQGRPLVRLLEVGSRHLILKSSRSGRDSGMIPIPWTEGSPSPLLGQVVWSWTQFNG